jgi:hypothetical protein
MFDTNHDYLKGEPLFQKRLSYKRKRSNDSRWYEDITDFLDFESSERDVKEMHERFALNYRLLNAQGDKTDYMDPMTLAMLEEEDVDIAFENIKHFDIISTIAQAMIGEQKKRPFKPIAFDTSGFTFSSRKRKKIELYQQYLNSVIIEPLVKQAEEQYMRENQIQDPFSLSPDEQQDMQSDINKRVEAMTPPEIEEYMSKKYRSPLETQAQKLSDYLSKKLNVKYVTDEGFKNLMATCLDVFHVGVRNGEPFVQICNPFGLRIRSSAESMFVQDSESVTYENYITLSDLYVQHGADLKEKDYKDLESLLYNGDMSHKDRVSRHLIDSKLVAELKGNESKYFGDDPIDISTRMGQERIKDLYGTLDSQIANTHVIRQLHATWISARKIKRILRRDKKTGKEDIFYTAENYTFDKRFDDEEKVVWAPEVQQCTKLGYGSPIYIKKGPLPWQYESRRNPFSCKLPYIGVIYNKMQGNVVPVSPIDRGKPWQYMFNWQMAKIEEKQATDRGKIAVMFYNAIPKGMSFNRWMTLQRYAKTMFLDTNQEGVNPSDMQAIKSLDLGNAADLANDIQILEFVKNQVAYAMCYNPSRLGQISPYTAVTNNQQNIIQSSNQTEDLYATHNLVVEQVMSALVRAARIAYKDNPIKTSFLMDDMSMAELELDSEMLDMSESGVFIANSSEESDRLNTVKSMSQYLINSQLINFPEYIRMIWANNGAEIMNLSEAAQERMNQAQQAAQQSEMQMQEQEFTMTKAIKEFEAQLKMMIDAQNNDSNERAAVLESLKFLKQMDVNENQINDSFEENQEKLTFEREKLAAEMGLKDKELSQADKHKQKEFEIKEEEVRVKEIAARKPRTSSK